MRLLVLAWCALFLSVSGYCQKELTADLLTVPRKADSVTAHLMLLAEKTHEPSREAVQSFAWDLVQALGSRQAPETAIRSMAAEIDSVFKSAGTSTVGFLEHLDRFRFALATVVSARGTAQQVRHKLENIGRQVRGPEDTPVRPAPARPRQ